MREKHQKSCKKAAAAGMRWDQQYQLLLLESILDPEQESMLLNLCLLSWPY
jgi:hypothetical protein